MREMARKFILMTMTLAKGTEANNNQQKYLEHRKRKNSVVTWAYKANCGTFQIIISKAYKYTRNTIRLQQNHSNMAYLLNIHVIYFIAIIIKLHVRSWLQHYCYLHTSRENAVNYHQTYDSIRKTLHIIGCVYGKDLYKAHLENFNHMLFIIFFYEKY